MQNNARDMQRSFWAKNAYDNNMNRTGSPNNRVRKQLEYILMNWDDGGVIGGSEGS
jgi:hypothetical protein